MRRVLVMITGAALILVAVVVFRTATITSWQITVEPVTPISLDMRQAGKRLAQAIRYRTVSYQDRSKIDGTEFLRFHQYLEQAFPRVHETLTREVVSDHSLLYTWKGSSPALNPILLIAHMDVVPADAENEGDWTYPPFDGRIADGYIWGRGTLDVKLAITASLEAIERLLERGFRPLRTVYLAFGHDEEIGGKNGAAKITSLLEERGVRLGACPRMVVKKPVNQIIHQETGSNIT